MTSNMRCRACISYLNERNCLSIENIGCRSTTFKEMFESSIGYQILPKEPQYFCDMCVQKLIEWYAFKDMCHKTQVMLSGIKDEEEKIFPVKTTEIVLDQNVTCMKGKPEDLLVVKPQFKIESRPTIESMKPVALSEPIEVKFTVKTRCLGREQIGELKMKVRTIEEFLHIVWLYIKPHLKQEIIIINENEAVWHTKKNPEEADMSRFISFSDRIPRRSVTIPTLANIKLWVGRDIILYVYPYSTSIKTRLQVTAAKILIASTSKKDQQKEKHEGALSDPIEVTFKVVLSSLGKQTPSGILQVKGSTEDDFLHAIWVHVEPHLKQEIIINDNEAAVWHTNKNPQEKDLSRFIAVSDMKTKHRWKYIPTLATLTNCATQGRQLTLFVYPYSKNIITKLQTKAAEALIANMENEFLSETDEPTRIESSENKNLFKLLQLAKHSKKTQLSCPFTQCSSLVLGYALDHHIENCRHNPNRKITHWCQNEGCDKSYPSKKEYKRHILVCRYRPGYEKQLLQCPQCPKMVQSLYQHIAHSHSTKVFICDKCGVTRKNKPALIAHFKYVHCPPTIKCDKCPAEFKQRKSFHHHMLREHPTTSGIDLKYKCNECSYQTYNKDNFRRHTRDKHTPAFPKFSCPKCDKMFLLEYRMKRHLQIHDETTQFHCSMCNYVTKTKVCLKGHMTLHEEWKYKCPVCQLKRRSSNEVRMHMKRKHPDHKLPPKFMILKESKRKGQLTQYTQSDDDGNNLN